MTLAADPGPDTVRAWDRLVAAVPHSDVAQLSCWANVRSRAGFHARYVLARRNGLLVGGAVVLRRRLPVLGAVGYVANGPVIAEGEARPDVSHALAAGLGELGHRHLRTLFVQPLHGGEDISARLLQRGFRPSTAGVAPSGSIWIDLTRDVDDIHRDLTKSLRRSLRAADARGLTVRHGTAADLPAVADLFARTAAHQRYPPTSLPYLRTLYDELHPGGNATVFVAELDGVPVAAELLTGCGGALRSRLTGMDRSGPARKVGAIAALTWHAMLWAKAAGYHTLDLGGLSRAGLDALRAGHRDLAERMTGPEYFKASFGGRPVRYPQPVELIPSPVVRAGYDLARRSELGMKAVAAGKQLLRAGTRR